MNRRSIFKLLAGAVCAAAMDVAGLKPITAPEQKIIGLNPEYFTAKYEAVYIWNKEAVTALIIKRSDNAEKLGAPQIVCPEVTQAVGSEEVLCHLPNTASKIVDPHIPRYQIKDGAYVQIPKYTELS